MVGLLLENRSLLWRALHFATVTGQHNVIKYLVGEAGVPAGLQCDGVAPLAIAVANGNLPVCTLLLSHGAQPNADLTIPVINKYHLRMGMTTLHLAAARGLPPPRCCVEEVGRGCVGSTKASR